MRSGARTRLQKLHDPHGDDERIELDAAFASSQTMCTATAPPLPSANALQASWW